MIEESGIKIDYYLKLTNEASMATVLSDFYNEEGELVSNTLRLLNGRCRYSTRAYWCNSLTDA